MVVDGEPAELDRAESAVRALMGDVERAVSRFRDDSELSRANAAAGRWTPVGSLTLHLVDVALDAARLTDGACDPTVGRHLAAAGYDDDLEVVRRRTAAPLAAAPAVLPDWRLVEVDHAGGRLRVPEGLALDLGATAKAWTADEAAARVHDLLGRPALVAVGGDLAVAGEHPWPVSVSEHEGGPGPILTLHHGGLATSSTAGRRWTTADGPRHHLLDPRTGRPAEGRCRTVSVRGASCVEANALSTAALVTGRVPEGTAARYVTTDGHVEVTVGWVA
nr:FAD:protein FMN transferase [Nocardioides flavescens]